MSKYLDDRKHIADYFRWLTGVYKERVQKARKMQNEYSQKTTELAKKLHNGDHVDSALMAAAADNLKISMTSEYVNGELLLAASNMEVMMNYVIGTNENIEDVVKTVNYLVSELQKVKSLPEKFTHKLSEIESKVNMHQETYDSLQAHLQKQKKAHEENQAKFEKSGGSIYG